MLNFETHQPLSEHLQQFISYYYFQDSGDVTRPFKFSFYPHFENALTIYKGSKVELLSDYHSKASPSDDDYFFTYSQSLKYACLSEIHPPFSKIGIVFKPLGLNHFIDGDLGNKIDIPFSLEFDVFRDSITPTLDKVFDAADIQEKAKFLDDYFSAAFVGFDEERMKKAVSLIMKMDEKLSVQELADQLGISRKTLLRLFQNHLKCSVKDYISLVQFRKALHLYQSSDEKPRLIQLTHEASYYDQSDFIHHFKKITGVNPKKFFSHITEIGSHRTIWELKD